MEWFDEKLRNYHLLPILYSFTHFVYTHQYLYFSDCCTCWSTHWTITSWHWETDWVQDIFTGIEIKNNTYSSTQVCCDIYYYACSTIARWYCFNIFCVLKRLLQNFKIFEEILSIDDSIIICFIKYLPYGWIM